MDKYLYLPIVDDYSQKLVKFALFLPESKIGNKVKNELVKSSANVVSMYKLACIEQPGENLIDRLNATLENLSLCKFWLDFIRSEEKIDFEKNEHLAATTEELIKNMLNLRKEEKRKFATIQTFAGEWLLDD